MSFLNRETIRDDLLTKLKLLTGLADDTGAIAHVFGQLPTSFNGLSPVCTVENGGWRPNLAGADSLLVPVRMIIGFWEKIGTRANAEDALDLFAKELADMLKANYNAKFYDNSMPFYELMDGVDYRGEYHFVEIEW
jgi:hypothetical protein